MNRSDKVFLGLTALGAAGALFFAFQLANLKDEAEAVEQKLEELGQIETHMTENQKLLYQFECALTLIDARIYEEDPAVAQANDITKPSDEAIEKCETEFPGLVPP